jgi:hypothetical protein
MRSLCRSSLLLIALVAVAGCSGNKEEPFKEPFAGAMYEEYVPPTAQTVAEGTGPLQFTPTTQGTLYLLDLSDMRRVKEMSTPHVVVTGVPLVGSTITFDPSTGTVTRQGKQPQKLTKIVPGHRYQLRWQPNKSS